VTCVDSLCSDGRVRRRPHAVNQGDSRHMPIELVVGALGISNAAIRIGQNESVAICLRGEPGVL